MLEEILDELGVAPAEALMVGDTTHDVRMGHNARVPVIAVSSGADSRETLQALGPRARLDSVAELAGWLRRAS